MFRADSAPLRTYGLVAAGDGGMTAARAEQLRAEGWLVRIVDGTEGVIPPAYRVAHVHGDGPCERSERVRLALEQLHQEQPFAVIEFPAEGGSGYRAIQAQRARLAFADVCLRVQARGASRGKPEARAEEARGASRGKPEARAEEARGASRGIWLSSACASGFLAGLEAAHAERYASEHAVDPRPAPTSTPLVTICIPHYNLGAHLPTTLASLAAQTYPHLEILVVDDGSTDAHAQRIFTQMQDRYPHFRFLRQPNAGIGATRNRALTEARGDYFVPMDADNVARPDMVERFVTALNARPDVAVLTCYFLAFATDDDLPHNRFLHAYRPTGGPHVLGCIRNVYGDATAIYRTAVLRAVSGWETDRDTSFEDWELFVKLVHAGYAIDVVPDHLFYYRHLPTGFSRQTDPFANHERVLRRFRRQETLSPTDRELLWDWLVATQRRLEHLEAQHRSLRYRLADRVRALCQRFVPRRRPSRRKEVRC